jgi:mannose-1-phosphate guanylyltransferase
VSVEAVIIAGGLGTRLLPLTERRPKHVLPVGGVPFLAHQLSKLAAAGVDSVVLATSYHADAFRPVFGDGSAYGLRLTYVRESRPLGTGGAIRNAVHALGSDPDQPVLVLNGDQLSGHDLSSQLARFAATDADVVLHLVRVADPRAYGCVPTAEDGTVLGFSEKSQNPVSDQVNAGCYVFRRRVIDTIPVDTVVSVERQTFPGLVASGHRVVGHVDAAYWTDVGTPALLVSASCDLVRGVVSSPAAPRTDGVALVQTGARVAGEVGGGTVVGPSAQVGDGAVVSASVLMDGAVVGPGARLERSVLGPAAVVGEGAHLVDVVLGDDARVGAGWRGVGNRVACGMSLS